VVEWIRAGLIVATGDGRELAVAILLACLTVAGDCLPK
jgi:hypothetical protein